MKTAGHNQEQTLLRSMKDGIEKMLMPATEIETRKLRSLNKELNLGLGVQSVSYTHLTLPTTD